MASNINDGCDKLLTQSGGVDVCSQHAVAAQLKFSNVYFLVVCYVVVVSLHSIPFIHNQFVTVSVALPDRIIDGCSLASWIMR